MCVCQSLYHIPLQEMILFICLFVWNFNVPEQSVPEYYKFIVNHVQMQYNNRTMLPAAFHGLILTVLYFRVEAWSTKQPQGTTITPVLFVIWSTGSTDLVNRPIVEVDSPTILKQIQFRSLNSQAQIIINCVTYQMWYILWLIDCWLEKLSPIKQLFCRPHFETIRSQLCYFASIKSRGVMLWYIVGSRSYHIYL